MRIHAHTREGYPLLMLVVTTNDIEGWEIQRVCGEVFGLTVRSRNAFSQMGAGFKSMFGGELQGMTKNLAESRNEAMGRLMADPDYRRALGRRGRELVVEKFSMEQMAAEIEAVYEVLRQSREGEGRG